MGNTWDFTLWVPCEDFREPVRLLLAAARTRGYAPLDASHPTSDILTSKLDEVAVRTMDELEELVTVQGGSLPLWSESADLLASFQPERRLVTLGSLHDLRADRSEDLEKTNDLLAIFRRAITSPLVAYGHSTDEWRLETVWQGKDFLASWRSFWEDVASQRPPPLLFWQSYLRADYLQRLDRAQLGAVPHRADDTEHGTVISLAAHPWEAAIAELDPTTGRYRLALASPSSPC